MKILDYLKNNILYFDGAMGTVLQKQGLKAGYMPEKWNTENPDAIISVHKAYFDAGANVVSTNTFGANILKFPEEELEEVIKNAVYNAKKAKELSKSTQEKWVALDIGPSGKLLKPFGDFEFEDAVSLFAKTVKIGVKYGVDLILIETMNDCYETKAALLAVKENCDLPVFASNAYGEDGKLMTGACPEIMSAVTEGMGADALGANCSFGPVQLKGVMDRLISNSSIPVMFMPNAGLPTVKDGKTIYDVTPEEFAKEVRKSVEKGVRIVGGCCGTTPEYIKCLVEETKGIKPVEIKNKEKTVVCSYGKYKEFGEKPLLVGERINPTGKKRLKEALRNNDMNYILNEALRQEKNSADILDINTGIPEIDEEKVLCNVVREIQSVTDLPLQIDTSNASAMERALRLYNGKAVINSVNGKEESMKSVFPLVKKYGGAVVALTLDENGIPNTVKGRLEIAEKIIKEASKYGISKKDIIFDALTMTISTDKNAGTITLETVQAIRENFGCHTILGVSNISFGLPHRDFLNCSFFAAALERGLSSAIMNTDSVNMMKTYYSYNALHGLDENCADYIRFADSLEESQVQTNSKSDIKDGKSMLQYAVEKGLKSEAEKAVKQLLETEKPMDIVTSAVIPALDNVGIGFENKKIYLPQLLMSAEAAGTAFEIIKGFVSAENTGGVSKCKVVLATVHGDIHDIGKNIVKLLLENYGFDVIDLGKDVPPEIIVEKAVEIHAPIVGLSALMTTTVPAMEKTVKMLKEKAPWCKTVVGGAVLTQEYAKSIGADKYAKDAMETVRFAEKVNSEKNT